MRDCPIWDIAGEIMGVLMSGYSYSCEIVRDAVDRPMLDNLSCDPCRAKSPLAAEWGDTLGDSLEVDIVANVRSGERKTPSFKSDERRSKVSRLQAKMAEFRLKHIVFHRSLYIR